MSELERSLLRRLRNRDERAFRELIEAHRDRVYNICYRMLGNRHESVNHTAKEYVRGNVHTNTIEGFFSLLKRGVYGTFHSVSKHHLHRYLDEFSFRYNTRELDDGERTVEAIRGAEGKRLVYRQPQATA